MTVVATTTTANAITSKVRNPPDTPTASPLVVVDSFPPLLTARHVRVTPRDHRREHGEGALMPAPSPDATPADDVRIAIHRGPRDSLRALFELAEDSAAELDSYIGAGRVLVARSGSEVIGHLQLTGTGDPGQAEIKNMAVTESRQGQGIGRRLVQAAVDLVAT